MLCLPVDARRQDTRARGAFGKWIIQHIDSWFAYAQDLGLGIDRMEEIILVTGCHRTRTWANTTFLEGQTRAQASFGVKVNGVNINWQFSLGSAHGAVCSWGPEGNVSVSLQEISISRVLKPIHQNLREDQCVFIRGFRVVRVLGIFPRQLKGAAGPNPSLDEDEDGHDPAKELVSIPASAKVMYFADTPKLNLNLERPGVVFMCY